MDGALRGMVAAGASFGGRVLRVWRKALDGKRWNTGAQDVEELDGALS